MCFPRCPGPAPPGRCSGPPVCTLCLWCCVYGVLGLLAPVHRRARPVCGVACTASWLLLSGVHALCVVLRVRCPGPFGSCSPVCLSVFCVLCLGVRAVVTVAPHCIAGQDRKPPVTTTPWPKAIGFLQSSALPMVSSASVRCVVCTVSWAPWLRITGVHALCVVVYVQRPGPPGSCSPVRVLAVCSSHASYPPPSSSLVCKCG